MSLAGLNVYSYSLVRTPLIFSIKRRQLGMVEVNRRFDNGPKKHGENADSVRTSCIVCLLASFSA